jgi:cell division protein FtsI (penicillin-binding protein 3)
LIGFTNSEHTGRAGVEMSQESVLKGEILSKIRERDRLGRVYEETKSTTATPNDVVLTISNSIQYKTEEALSKGARNSRAKSGKVVVLDPQTGEILAMANYPTFDPNDFRNIKPATWKNRAIQDSYSPGSVFKMITYGAALEEDLIKPEKTINCGEGSITVSGHTFNDSHTIGTVSYTRAFAQSSNVGAIKTGLRVGKDRFYEYARHFGFGQKTGIRLPAETSGILRSPKTWNGDSLASMSIGYEIGVTALQSAVAFATIANDGVKIQPHVIKEIRQSDGKIVSITEPEKERVVSVETARDLRKMMQRVVTDGTAKQARLSGYTSAGKTGTAWKYDPKLKAINKNKYVSSFIGFAPADNPRVVIAVVLDEPKGGSRNGGDVAAPIFREIAEQVLPELNVLPDRTIIVDSLDEDEGNLSEEDSADTNVVNKREKIAQKKKTKDSDMDKKSDEDKKGQTRTKGKATTADRRKLKTNKTGAGKDRKT